MKTTPFLKAIIYTFFLLAFQSLQAQTTVSGTVYEKGNLPIIGANLFIEGGYDGGITDENGAFSFTTTTKGIQVLSVSYLGYESKTIEADVATLQNRSIKLRESAATLDAVEISASTFKAGDNSKLAVLNPIDMVTTAGSMGDVIAAIQTLPGTQSNPDDGRLFVRGGDASETKIYIDGMRVFSPYTRNVRGTPSRGRYSPFLFKGVSFSTGGYDAEFGQALSGVLDMNTNDEPIQTETNLSLMTIGLGVGHTQKGEKASLSLSTSYMDLTPFYWLAPTALGLDKPFKALSGEAVFRYKLGKGLLKTYVAGDRGAIAFTRNNLNTQGEESIDVENKNFYANSSYNTLVTDRTSIMLGGSFGYNKDKFIVDSLGIDSRLHGYHFKAQAKTVVSDFFILNYGAEVVSQTDTTHLETLAGAEVYSLKVDRVLPALYASSDYYFSKDFALKVGLRYEHNNLLGTYEFDPRITLAYKVSKNGQLSAAYGQYHQEIDDDFLYQPESIINEKATHYLLNYNLKSEKHILRLEAFYKDYSDLLTYDAGEEQAVNLGNNGSGTVYGFDVFLRGNNLIKFMDFWVSYSWLQNDRKYLDFPDFATPVYSTTHNLSVVTKRWFENLKSSVSFTYSMTSGRPYDNPNTPSFMTERSSYFHNMSLSWAYLISQQKIFFVSVSNAPGFKNEFGRRYTDMPDPSGFYRSEQIRPNDDRFFFAGFFITMSADKKTNQLDTL